MYVLFVDLAGFTRFSELRGDSAAAELACAFCMKAMQIGRRKGLRPVKTVGDAVIFVAADVQTANNGAKALLDEFDGVKHPLPVHIGIARGPVVERDGDIFGVAVNLAAHLSRQARAGEIAYSDDVTKELFELDLGRSAS